MDSLENRTLIATDDTLIEKFLYLFANIGFIVYSFYMAKRFFYLFTTHTHDPEEMHFIIVTESFAFFIWLLVMMLLKITNLLRHILYKKENQESEL